MAFGFFRGIWITLRATNYTTRAFQDTIKGLTKLQQKQIEFRLSSGRNLMAVGMMYVALGGMAMMTMSKIMSMSSIGEQVMSRFSERINKSLGRLSESLARIVEPILNVVANLLEIATANPILTNLLSLILVVGTGIMLATGATLAFSGATKIATAFLWIKSLALKNTAKTLDHFWKTETVATTATWTFASAVHAVFIAGVAAFGVYFLLKDTLGQLPAVLLAASAAFALLAVQMWMAAGAMSVLSWGAAAVAGGLAIAGAIAAAANLPEHQMGTSFVRKGGMAFVHAGEEIISARESLAARGGRGGAGAGGDEFSRLTQRVDIAIENVNTKADIDDLDEKLARSARKRARGRR